MPSRSCSDVLSLAQQHDAAPPSRAAKRFSLATSTPRKTSVDSMKPDSGRSAMRNGAQRSICVSNKKPRSSFQCQIESYDLDSSKARIRELLVSIAGKKTELQDIDWQLEETEAKEQQLERFSHHEKASYILDRVPYHLDHDEGDDWRRSEFDAKPSLPDRFFPAFEFDGEYEGTFKRARHRGWSIIGRKLFSTNKGSRSSSSWTVEQPQLTLDSSSSYSYGTEGYSSELDDVVVHDFPAPPGFHANTWHCRDMSTTSGLTFMSTSTGQDEISAVLEAKSMFLQRKTSKGPMLVQINPLQVPHPRMRSPIPKRQSNEQRNRWRSSKTGPPDAKLRYRQYGYDAMDLQGPKAVNQMQSVIESPRLDDSHMDNKRQSQFSTQTSSIYSREAMEETQSKIIHPAPRNEGTQPIRRNRTVGHGPPERIPPRTSSLYHHIPSHKSLNLHPYPDAFGTASRPNLGLVDFIPTRPPPPHPIKSNANTNTFDSIVLSKADRPPRSRQRRCLPKLCDRLLLKRSAKRRPGVSRLRAWLRPSPLNPSWWKARHSAPVGLHRPGSRMSYLGNIRSTNSSPLPNIRRASSAYQLEHTLMAMVQSSNASSNNSALMSPSRTLRAIHRASYVSIAESSVPSTPGTPPSIFTRDVEPTQRETRRMTARFDERLHLTASELELPDARVIQSFMERPATHRRIPSLAELA